MLRVTIEVLPFGYEDEAQTIAVATITNIGISRARPEYGDYEVEIDDGMKTTHNLRDFPCTEGAVVLVARALSDRPSPDRPSPF